MLKESIANKVKVSTTTLHLVLMNSKLTPCSLSLMQILLWLHFENNIANLNTNRLQLWCNFFTWSHNLAEVIIIDTIQVCSANIFLPLIS